MLLQCTGPADLFNRLGAFLPAFNRVSHWTDALHFGMLFFESFDKECKRVTIPTLKAPLTGEVSAPSRGAEKVRNSRLYSEPDICAYCSLELSSRSGSYQKIVILYSNVILWTSMLHARFWCAHKCCPCSRNFRLPSISNLRSQCDGGEQPYKSLILSKKVTRKIYQTF